MRRGNRTRDEGDALVLALLAGATRPLSAYQVRTLAAAQGEKISPTQVYRVMERLIAAGQVRRIEALSAYLAVSGEGEAIMICRRCRSCRPLESGGFGPLLSRAMAESGFAAERTIIEAVGLCADCRTTRAVRA